MSEPVGPNMKRLMIHKIAIDAVPPGGGVESAVNFLCDPSGLQKGAASALAWCQLAVAAVRGAAEPNEWKNRTDEEIAGELLRRIDEKKRGTGR